MNKIGIILAVILTLLTANSTYYFFSVVKVNFTQWIVFNACAPSNIVYLAGFITYLITKDRIALHIAILPIFFFGGLGLYLFPWGGFNIIPQISHIFMVLNILWVLTVTFRTGDYKSAMIGMLIGLIVFAPFINFQQTYAYTHPKEFNKILGVGNEEFQKKYNIEKGK
jgi:hypothetical protein